MGAASRTHYEASTSVNVYRQVSTASVYKQPAARPASAPPRRAAVSPVPHSLAATTAAPQQNITSYNAATTAAATAVASIKDAAEEECRQTPVDVVRHHVAQHLSHVPQHLIPPRASYTSNSTLEEPLSPLNGDGTASNNVAVTTRASVTWRAGSRVFEHARRIQQAQTQVLYDEAQVQAKTPVLRSVVEVANEWNAHARRASRLQQIARLEQNRQDVQAQRFDSTVNLRMLLERESELQARERESHMSGECTAPLLPTASGEMPMDIRQHAVVSDRTGADARFMSSLQLPRGSGGSPATSPLSAVLSARSSHAAAAQGGRKEVALFKQDARDDFKFIRILASHSAHGGRAAPPRALQSSILSTTAEYANEAVGTSDTTAQQSRSESPQRSDIQSPMTGGRRVSLSPPRMSPHGKSPTRSSLATRMLPSTRTLAEDGAAGVSQGEGAEEHHVCESQEAIAGLLGQPSPGQLGEIARQKIANVIMVDGLASHKEHLRRHAPVVYRSKYGIMTNDHLCSHEQRDNTLGCKGKGLDTPLGLPMQVCRCVCCCACCLY